MQHYQGFNKKSAEQYLSAKKRMFSGKADKPDKNCPIIAN